MLSCRFRLTPQRCCSTAPSGAITLISPPDDVPVIDGVVPFEARVEKDFRCEGSSMATVAGMTETVLYDTLVNYLVSMARAVEGAMNRALEAIVSVDHPKASALIGEVFLLEPRVNEMEIVIDE